MAGGSNPPSATSPSDPVDRLAASVADGTNEVPEDAPLVLAVSGGPDSTALLHGALRLVTSGRRRWRLVVAHVDHQLREGSATEADRVTDLAQLLGLEYRLHGADVAEWARRWATTVEDAGRRVRYRFFDEVAEEVGPGALIATAHTADDVAETIVLRIARGSGLKGIRGIPARRGRVIRPLLQARRADLRGALDEAGVAYTLDPSNDDPSYAARNLVRAEIMPALERLNPRIVEALQRLGRLASDDDDVLDALAAGELANRSTADGLDWHRPPSRAVGRRVLRLAVGEPAPSAERIEALLDAAEGPRGGLTVELGGGRVASVRSRQIVIGTRAK